MAATKTHNVPFAIETINVADKGILITGGTSGIGRAAALLLASHGAKVFVFGRHQDQLTACLAEE